MAAAQFADGLGNIIGAIQWDDVPATAAEILTFTNGRATLDRRGVLGIIDGAIRINVGVGDWVALDKDRHVFVLSNSQITSSYTAVTTP